MPKLADFHIHPDYSIDAEGDIDSYCRKALSIGLNAICFTPHYDPNPRRVEADGFWRYKGERVRVLDRVIESYISDVREANSVYKDHGLEVYCGLEIDFFPGAEKEAEKIRSKFDFDFVIGSVHCLDDIAISNSSEVESYFSRKTVNQMADDYFELLLMAASCTEFDCLGHLDYYTKFGRDFYGVDIDKIEIDRYDPVFDKLIESGVGIEINTRRYRTEMNAFHPDKLIIEKAVRSGVRIASVGSDSHNPRDLGKGLEEAYSYLESLSVKPALLQSL
ncbi:MAG: histidinol-phosphatase HisJ family protein [candidate division Zixibacteria bacterium]